jgi:hypothetical protein
MVILQCIGQCNRLDTTNSIITRVGSCDYLNISLSLLECKSAHGKGKELLNQKSLTRHLIYIFTLWVFRCETLDKICIWCNVLVLHFNPWVEASAGGLIVLEGLYNSVANSGGSRNFEKGGPLPKGGAHPLKLQKNNIFWVPNLGFYWH